jgi:precorrin-6Y C5,15-methyltransferase (decarboxylating)
MTPIQVIGIGLDGEAGLTDSVRQIIDQATVLVGSDRHLSYFPNHPAERLILGNFHQAIQTIRQYLSPSSSPLPPPGIIVLTSGDPLFFGLGRLLLAELPPDQLTFHPHISSVQLAFSRIKLPWQDARVISAHGRSLDELTQALQQGIEKIAVLTDSTNTPAAIARLLLSLDLPNSYECWVCENLGGENEQVQSFLPTELVDQTFEPLNIVVLWRNTAVEPPLDLNHLPVLGLPDHSFLSFSDRPSLMTKREVRLLVLGELALQAGQIIWDIGAGTGSVSIEIARLFPTSKIFAVEKTAVGSTLVQHNSQRFQVNNIVSIHGTAPDVLESLPSPDRIFIGGSGGNIHLILDMCGAHLQPGGVIVLALATVEHLHTALHWRSQQVAIGQLWEHRMLQVQLARSLPIGSLTRFSPLNPVTLLTLVKGSC